MGEQREFVGEMACVDRACVSHTVENRFLPGCHSRANEMEGSDMVEMHSFCFFNGFYALFEPFGIFGHLPVEQHERKRLRCLSSPVIAILCKHVCVQL